MLTFGKYKGKDIKDITDSKYFQYLSDYSYSVSYTFEDSSISAKLIIDDLHFHNLNYILKNLENPEIFNKIAEVPNITDKIKILYDNRKYFEKNINYNIINKIFSNFYLYLNHNDIILETRKYLKETKICAKCGVKHNDNNEVETEVDNWNTNIICKKCFIKLLKSHG